MNVSVMDLNPASLDEYLATIEAEDHLPRSWI
jgi:hypothetical protein